MRIVFMGTPEFAVPSLELLAAEGYRPIAVVTGPDRPRGRGQVISPMPVKEAAVRLEIDPILQPESVRDSGFAAMLRDLNADLLVVVAFRVLPPEVFTASRLGAFNLHGSLLPRYRGAAPINRAIMAGERETGVTTFFLKEKVDTGSIILQRKMEIGPDETAGEVHDRMMQIGARAVLETVQLIEQGQARPEPQRDAEATPAPKIFRDDARIPWQSPAVGVHNHVRGLSPHPGAWTTIEGRLLKILRTRRTTGEGEPGTVIEAGDRLVVACGQDAVEIVELQLEGKRRVRAAEFLRGHTLKEGVTLDV